jgi:spermidine synthase
VPRHPRVRFLLPCFFLSGATALIYEVVWLRMLALIVGHTVYAISIVLAAFMAGLAVGSLVFGRLAPRLVNPIRVYGYLELGIGVWAGAVPILLHVLVPRSLELQGDLALPVQASALLEFLTIGVVLFVPTMLMGGTLPVLSQILGKPAEAGRAVGTLYGVNTAGAVLGVALAGYGLLSTFGNHTTSALAALANILLGVIVLGYTYTADPRGLLAPGEGAVSPTDAARRSSTDDIVRAPATLPARDAAAVLAALGASGALSMLYEVAWTRALALVIGSSTYAFTSMLVAFLSGIAAGSALYAWLFGGERPSPARFAAIQAGIGSSVLLAVLLFERMPEWFLTAFAWSHSPAFVQVVQLGIGGMALLLPAMFIGATLPCAVGLIGRDGAGLGRDVGLAYAANTAGAIAGTVAAGFLVIPAIGVHAAITLGIAANFLAAFALLLITSRSPVRWRWSLTASAILAGLVVVALPSWDQHLMTSGPAVYATKYTRLTGTGTLRDSLSGDTLLFYRDGLNAAVSVHQKDTQLSLRINGKTDASTGLDMPTQLLCAHLPLLLHPAAERVLVIGLGSGMTAGAAARHPIAGLDIVEIEPAVVRASDYFAKEHGNVLDDPRVRLTVGDARQALLTRQDRYDDIISEPSNPWISGLASLFSLEFFDLARRHLRPGGMMVQWVEYYSLSPDDIRMVVATFQRVFPHVTIWGTGSGDLLLLGRTESSPIDVAALKARYESLEPVWPDLRRAGIIGWAGLFGYAVMGPDEAARMTRDADLNTDDRLPLEFSAPRSLYLGLGERNRDWLRTYATEEFPDVSDLGITVLKEDGARAAIGVALLSRHEIEDALTQFQTVLQARPEHALALLGSAHAQMLIGRPTAAFDLAERVLLREPANLDALLLAVRASEALNEPGRAVRFLEQASGLQPENMDVRRTLDRLRLLAGKSPGPALTGEASP